jgi:NAD-dependent SIR2 family protein deacetylase
MRNHITHSVINRSARTFFSLYLSKPPKTTKMVANPDYNSVPAFHAKLARSRRILAVCGAGLSASSGLATFRGAGGLWRNYEATMLASPEAFEADPGLVWMFYAYVGVTDGPRERIRDMRLTTTEQRRHMALKAEPNQGHYALAALAKRNPEFLCISQNVDRQFHPNPFPYLHLQH